MNRKDHLSLEGLHKILSIRASINLGLSKEQQTAFPDIRPVLRPIVEPAKPLILID